MVVELFAAGIAGRDGYNGRCPRTYVWNLVLVLYWGWLLCEVDRLARGGEDGAGCDCRHTDSRHTPHDTRHTPPPRRISPSSPSPDHQMRSAQMEIAEWVPNDNCVADNHSDSLPGCSCSGGWVCGERSHQLHTPLGFAPYTAAATDGTRSISATHRNNDPASCRRAKHKYHSSGRVLVIALIPDLMRYTDGLGRGYYGAGCDPLRGPGAFQILQVAAETFRSRG